MRTDLVTSIGELVGRAAETWGDRPLWTHGERTVSFAEYDDTTSRVAAALIALGVEPGQRVATYLGNSIELLEAYSGIAKAGAVTVFCNALLTQREIDYVTADSEAVAIVTDAEHRSVASGTGIENVIVVGDESWSAMTTHDHGELPTVGVDDEAWIGYTSGTTGRPKGASLSHRNSVWVAAAVSDSLGLTADDRILCCLPMFHSYAVNSCYLQPIMVGAHQFILERFTVPDVLAALRRHRITVLPAVPTMLTYLANADADEVDGAAPDLRIVVSAGAVLKERVSAEFEARFGAPIHDGWGSTETGSFATITPAGATRKPGSCGLPLRGSNIRIVDVDGNDVRPGGRGELVVRGPNVMSRYLNKPDQTEQTLADGWYHSGDVASVDHDGYVFVVDRLKDLIISGGYNIAPKEIEDVILAHAAVLDVAVIGLPDQGRGEIPKAFVVVKPGQQLDDDELMAHCRAELAAYKLPREIAFTDELPKTSSGKVKRYVLRQRPDATDRSSSV